MTSGTLIPLNRFHRLLKKADGYTVDAEAFLADTATAVTVLLDALPHAGSALQLKILPLIGYAGKDRALWPLYHLMMGVTQNEMARTTAALQLGVAASMSDDSSALVTVLIEKLNHPDPAVRSNSALALGWEGNQPAVSALMAHLCDTDQDVQAAVVLSLSSVGNDCAFDLLAGRLEIGTVEERRMILLHLWRFAKQRTRVEDIYLKCVANCEPELCLDILAGLAMIPLSPNIIDIYGRFLIDNDARIRLKVLENLSEINPPDYPVLNRRLHGLLMDENRRVRQAAIRLFAQGK